MAATGTPASRNARAVFANATLPPASQVPAPGRISIALPSGVRSASATSGMIRIPPAVVTGSAVSATVTTR
jgi:hypothetical protein